MSERTLGVLGTGLKRLLAREQTNENKPLR